MQIFLNPRPNNVGHFVTGLQNVSVREVVLTHVNISMRELPFELVAIFLGTPVIAGPVVKTQLGNVLSNDVLRQFNHLLHFLICHKRRLVDADGVEKTHGGVEGALGHRDPFEVPQNQAVLHVRREVG